MLLQQSTISKPGDGDEIAHDHASNQLNPSSSSSPDAPNLANAHTSTTTSDEFSTQNKGQKATLTGRVEVRLLVRRREAGALIGKRGANIKRLRETFAKSTFNIPDTGNGPERVVCIAADSLASLEAILADLAQLFLEKSCQLAKFQPTRRNQDLHDQIELKQLINSFHAGLLIGMGGQSIRKLRNDSKAAIKIYEMCCPNSNERVCAIKAKPPVVVATIKMVQQIIDASPPALKASLVHKPYDALHYDLSLLDKYGGYAPDDLGPLELMQLAGAQTNRDQFAPSALDVHHHLIGANSNKSTLPRNNHFRPQRSMFPSAAALASHQAGLLPGGIGALLGALDQGMLSAANLMRPPAPSLTRELNHRGGHHHAARYHPYLASSSSSPPPLPPLPGHLHEHERLLIAQHLQMLSAHQHRLLLAPNASGCRGASGCACCSHSQHQHNYKQQQQQQHDNQRVSSSCSCAPAGCETDTLAQRSPLSGQTSGDLHSRTFADKCAPSPVAHDKQIGQGQPPV